MSESNRKNIMDNLSIITLHLISRKRRTMVVTET